MVIVIKAFAVILIILCFSCSNNHPTHHGADTSGDTAFTELSFDQLNTSSSVYPSMAIDSSGVIHITYYDDSLLKYVRYDGAFNIKEVARSLFRLSPLIVLNNDSVKVVYCQVNPRYVFASSIINSSFTTDTLFNMGSRTPHIIRASHNNNNELIVAYVYSYDLGGPLYLAVHTKKNNIWGLDSVFIDSQSIFCIGSALYVNNNGVYYVWCDDYKTNMLKFDGTNIVRTTVDTLKNIYINSLFVDPNDNPYILYLGPYGADLVIPLNLIWKETGQYHYSAVADSLNLSDPVSAVYNGAINVVYTRMIENHRNQIIYCISQNNFEKKIIKDYLDNNYGGFPFVMKDNSPVICYYESAQKTMKLLIAQ